MHWLASQDKIVRSEVVATKRQSRVLLAFPRFPTLSGWVRHNCLAVYAHRKHDDTKAILELDSLPIRIEGTQTFVCGFCQEERRTFEGREALWADHLFEPFAEWVHTKLHPSESNERVPTVERVAEFAGDVDHFRKQNSARWASVFN